MQSKKTKHTASLGFVPKFWAPVRAFQFGLHILVGLHS